MASPRQDDKPEVSVGSEAMGESNPNLAPETKEEENGGKGNGRVKKGLWQPCRQRSPTTPLTKAPEAILVATRRKTWAAGSYGLAWRRSLAYCPPVFGRHQSKPSTNSNSTLLGSKSSAKISGPDNDSLTTRNILRREAIPRIT